MDIFQALKEDHEEAKKLFKTIGSSKPGAGSGLESTFSMLTQMLKAHMEAEEKVFYKPLEDKPEARELISEGYKEHKEANGLITESKRLSIGGDAWLTRVHKLQEAVEHHVEEEEGKIFPAAKKIIDTKQAQDMAKSFETTKQSMMKGS